MFRPGRAPVTARLIAEHGPDADGWWPARELHPAHGRAAVGYRVRGRNRGPSSWFFHFFVDLAGITGPTVALILLLGVSQASSLGYLQ